MQEGFPHYRPLYHTTTGEDVFLIMDSFFDFSGSSVIVLVVTVHQQYQKHAGVPKHYEGKIFERPL